MCMSPHEMTSAQIESRIQTIRAYIEERPDQTDYWTGVIENLEALLKERAENGTYATAGGVYNKPATPNRWA